MLTVWARGASKNIWDSHVGTIALNCLVFFSRENRVFAYAFWRRTDGRTNRWTASMRKGAFYCRDRRRTVINIRMLYSDEGKLL